MNTTKIPVQATTVALASIFALAMPYQAQASDEVGPLAVVVDTVVVRPVTLVATVLGAGLFVVALPFSIPSKSVKRTGDLLVGRPARTTFVRPLGDLGALADEDMSPSRAPSEPSGAN